MKKGLVALAGAVLPLAIASCNSETSPRSPLTPGIYTGTLDCIIEDNFDHVQETTLRNTIIVNEEGLPNYDNRSLEWGNNVDLPLLAGTAGNHVESNFGFLQAQQGAFRDVQSYASTEGDRLVVDNSTIVSMPSLNDEGYLTVRETFTQGPESISYFFDIIGSTENSAQILFYTCEGTLK